MVLHERQLTQKVIGAAIEVHRELGPGLLESAYSACLAYELSQRRLPFEREKPLPLTYKRVKLDCSYRADFIIDGRVLVELKAVGFLHPIHEAQLLTYLRLAGRRVGLLMNFDVPVIKDGIVRRVL